MKSIRKQFIETVVSKDNESLAQFKAGKAILDSTGRDDGRVVVISLPTKQDVRDFSTALKMQINTEALPIATYSRLITDVGTVDIIAIAEDITMEDAIAFYTAIQAPKEYIDSIDLDKVRRSFVIHELRHVEQRYYLGDEKYDAYANVPYDKSAIELDAYIYQATYLIGKPSMDVAAGMEYAVNYLKGVK